MSVIALRPPGHDDEHEHDDESESEHEHESEGEGEADGSSLEMPVVRDDDEADGLVLADELIGALDHEEREREQRQPERTLRPRASQSRRGWVVFLVAIAFALTAAAVAHVWVRLRVIHLGYQISRGSMEEQRLLEQHKRLEIEAAVLRQPGRVEQIARERLGMARPDPEHIHVIRIAPTPVSSREAP